MRPRHRRSAVEEARHVLDADPWCADRREAPAVRPLLRSTASAVPDLVLRGLAVLSQAPQPPVPALI